MELHTRVYELEYTEPFVISRSADTHSQVVQVAIRHGDLVGYGEGAPDEHYHESIGSALAYLELAEPMLGDDPLAIDAVLTRIGAIPGEMAARCAIDGALHDLLGKICDQPLWRILGLERTPPPTSYTISIDTVEGTSRRAAAAAAYHALKIKVGGAADIERVRAVRAQAPAALIRVDANEAWTVHSTVELVPELRALGVELIEQPLPAGDSSGYARLHDTSLPIPILLDESCHTLPDVAAAANLADGVNIKLTKSGGIREAVRMIHAARALDLRVMLGCMNESTLGIAQAAQISPLVDVVDLDGHLLNKNDSHTGLSLTDGRVLPGDGPGLGVTPLERWP